MIATFYEINRVVILYSFLLVCLFVFCLGGWCFVAEEEREIGKDETKAHLNTEQVLYKSNL